MNWYSDVRLWAAAQTEGARETAYVLAAMAALGFVLAVVVLM